MQINEDIYNERYGQLNERQREAVNHIYGPVMVIAGPGTGKTEVLSMRIANLLRSEAQVQPHEILCLTYTDEATNSMRRRLLQVIGTAAHKVNIFTFHAFCNNVIQNNSEYFRQGVLQPISELERTELLYKLLENLPRGHVLRRLSGNIYYDAGKLQRLFDLMKREHLTPEIISSGIDDYVNDLPNREEYIYKKAGKGYSKGDLKQTQIDEEVRKMEETRAAALLFTEYEHEMNAAGRYDFNDMILWVLDAFNHNPALLQQYQERYQFVLVDEFQDTNGSQNELLNSLTSYWDDPNIFVVGDDDQGVFEFQGARIRNIVDFYERHREHIRIVVLPHNYRSSQEILNLAMATIRNNEQRLISQLTELDLDKNIIASAPRFSSEAGRVVPVIRAYANILQEEAGLVMQIEALQRQGVALNEIAVIYAQHKQADNITALLERKNIPYNVKKPVDILKEPLVAQLLNILRYLEAERKNPFDGESLLFETMHAPYFGIEPADIAHLALYIQSNRKDRSPLRWRVLLANALLLESLELRSAKAMQRLGNNLDQWEKQQNGLPLPLLIEKIVHESGMVAGLVRTVDHVWNLQVLYTFFEFVKDAFSRNQRLKAGELLQMVEKMNDEGIDVPLQRVVQHEHGVYCYTAHSSKGNEFEYVFLVGCTTNFWEDKRGGSNEYRLPDTLTATADDPGKNYKKEVARRLFYVALTRAKKHLQISYALNDNLGKALTASVFVDEVSKAEDREMVTVPEEEIIRHLEWAMQPVPEVTIKIANAQWIERVLQQFVMSVTSLTKYLKCPLTFYYETLLKVPYQKNDALAFGSAVHYALEKMFLDMKSAKGMFPGKDQVLGAFQSAMYSEMSSFSPVQFERRMEQGRTILTEYYDRYIGEFATDVEIEFKVPRYLLDGVPVTGKIDKIEMHGATCKVVDYKTGDPDKSATALVAPPNDKEPLGGDYWRQMVFYKLLLEHYEDKRFQVTEGAFDFIQKNKKGEFKRFTVPVYAQDEATVRHQLKDTYSRIMNHEFDRGCGREDCHWCNFARRYELIRPVRDESAELDDL